MSAMNEEIIWGDQQASVSTDFFILAILLLINMVMVVAMMVAARTLGQPVISYFWAAAFASNIVMYVVNGIYLSLFRDNIAWLCLLNVFAMLGPSLATIAFRIRVGLSVFIRRPIGVQILCLAFTLYFSLVDPNPDNDDGNPAPGLNLELFTSSTPAFGLVNSAPTSQRQRADAATVPEPASLVALTLGVLAVGARRRAVANRTRAG